MDAIQEALLNVQRRVRELVQEHPALSETIRSAFDDYCALHVAHRDQLREMEARRRHLAREQLSRGLLFGKPEGCTQFLVEVVKGLFPVELVRAFTGRDAMPIDLGQRMAAATVQAMDRDAANRACSQAEFETRAAEELSWIERGTHIDHTQRIWLPQPADWPEIVDPFSLNEDDLRSWPEADYRTIVLHRLGGLADAGALSPHRSSALRIRRPGGGHPGPGRLALPDAGRSRIGDLADGLPARHRRVDARRP